MGRSSSRSKLLQKVPRYLVILDIRQVLGCRQHDTLALADLAVGVAGKGSKDPRL
jgi:hypothetical protein